MFKVPQSQESPLLSPSPAKKRKMETSWPAFHNNGNTYPTEFNAGVWKCPLCHKSTPRIRQHLADHKDLIDNWTAAEVYCEEVTLLKRREVDRERDRNRAKDPKRKEEKRKADQRRAEDPKRKEEKRKADQKPMSP